MDDDECECDEGAPAWMATFSDLATLLLTFFVLLLSFAEMDITEFKTMLGSIRDAFGVQTYDPGPYHAASTSLIELMDRPANPMALSEEERNLLRAIRRYIQDHGLEDAVDVMNGENGVIVRMKDNVLFASGSAEVLPEGREILVAIGQLAAAFPEGLSVEGHTDDRPIHTSRFPSNWELSTARATEALGALQEAVDLSELRRLQVVGYADTAPIDSNDTDEGRARNRRVEFIFRRTAPRPQPLTETSELLQDADQGSDGDTNEEGSDESAEDEASGEEAAEETSSDGDPETSDGDQEGLDAPTGDGDQDADPSETRAERADTEVALPEDGDPAPVAEEAGAILRALP